MRSFCWEETFTFARVPATGVLILQLYSCARSELRGTARLAMSQCSLGVEMEMQTPVYHNNEFICCIKLQVIGEIDCSCPIYLPVEASWEAQCLSCPPYLPCPPRARPADTCPVLPMKPWKSRGVPTISGKGRTMGMPCTQCARNAHTVQTFVRRQLLEPELWSFSTSLLSHNRFFNASCALRMWHI